MAKFNSSTFGTISGKHGSAVAVTRKDGVCYIRMHVIPHNPRTDKQQAHRSKIGLVSKSLAPFNPIFKHTMGVTNGISTARSHAFKNAIVGEYPNFEVDYSQVMFSFGAIEKLHKSSFVNNEGVISINWDFQEMHNCHGDDSVSFVVFNKDTKQVLHLDDVAMRSEKELKIEVYDSWAVADLYLWAYVRSEDKISDSVFVGEGFDDELLCADSIPTDIQNIDNSSIDEGSDDVVSPNSDAKTYKNESKVDNNSVAEVKHNNDNELLREVNLAHKKVLSYLLDNGSISMNAIEELLGVQQGKAHDMLSELASMELKDPKVKRDILYLKK